MAHSTLTEKNWQYVVNTDADLPVAQRLWAVVKTELRDELTNGPLAGSTRLTSDHPEFIGIARTEGGAGLLGVPANVLSQHKTQTYPLRVAVDSDGYVPDAKSFTIPSSLLFPTDFTPFDLGIWPLRRQPISIYGRVSLISGTDLLPVAGAHVSLTKLWRIIPSPVLNPPPDPFVVASLRPALYAARPVGAAITRQPLNLIPSTFTTQKDPQAGDSWVFLSNTVGLAAGQILAFDRLDPEHAEFLTIASITGSTAPSQPASVQLLFPLAERHTAVELMTPGAAGAANTLGVDAIPGEVILLANSLTGISNTDVIRVAGGSSGPEYHTAFLFAVLSDSRGLYRLPKLSRVAQLELIANDGVHNPVPQPVIPDYREGQNRVDFDLR
jgi:hypothetical protein